MKPPFFWDAYSDQPHVLKDKAYKKRMRALQWMEYLKTFLSALFILPVAVLGMKFFKPKTPKPFELGLCVNLDKGEEQIALVEELGVKHLLCRFPLWDMQNIEAYVTFLKRFGDDKHIVLCIMQDREHIEDLALTALHVTKVFELFSPFVREFQIGNAINRAKWGFFSVGEYLRFYACVQKLRDESFPKLLLLGPSIIDFEYHYTARALFNGFKIRFDKHTSLLYVDRRGAPENAQLGFNTLGKINLLYALCAMSSKSSDDIYITEVNWPLSNTAPYAPTSEKECVSETDYATFLKAYIRTAKESGKVRKLFWHQLIAPGYGLVDNREGIRKMEGFYAFKEVLHETIH
ncbi:hypothetical protein [Sulfurospirillum barnesii]|uniref:Uncharacterized protein n=1 Tax=Sulfurospirillum barnesii (strain ATCC 700032 / DSM 10660 / SES-3) TaxID=760154 RepID=I3XYZ6_SULBS|nr:hypothetical protein [Sulfurospirillum barnesii]AFL69170.1 hypothetical protein Sulba_1890 [Sulfurospirillum barnesii SES-3]